MPYSNTRAPDRAGVAATSAICSSAGEPPDAAGRTAPFPHSMLPLVFGWSFSLPLFGKDHLARAASHMAVTLCQPYKHSKRYGQMVEYYSWKLERRYQRNVAYKGFALCHDAVVMWVIAYQLLRLIQLAQFVLTLAGK